MLPAKRRIRKTAFTELLTSGVYGVSPLFSVRYVRTSKFENGEGGAKSIFAVVVSKKVANSASARNKIKRRCYHVLRELAPKIKDSRKIVFFVKKGVEKLSFARLSENILAVLSKNNLIN